MVVISLSSPLQPQPGTKIIPDKKKTTFMKDSVLFTDSSLEVYQKWQIKKR